MQKDSEGFERRTEIMSMHPNVLLIAVLTPANTSRATMRAIMAEA